MKEKLKNKKVVYTIIGIVSVLLVMLAVTYAYWLVTKTQDKENVISSACLDIAISGEKNDITLTNQFPMSDEEGMKLVPYEFTVTNNCNTSVDYQVALEATGDSSNALKGTSLKVALNDSAKLYSAYPNVDTTIEGAYESRVLGYSKLSSGGSEGSSDTYSLRIWIDEDAPISEMNKTFKSRISVTIGQGIESPYEEGTLAYSILSNVGGPVTINEIRGEFKSDIISSGSEYIGTSKYYYGTEYTFDETTKQYTLSGTLTQATLTECRNGTKTCGKYTLMNTSSTYSSLYLYEITDFKSSGNSIDANTISSKNEFEKELTANAAGIYKTQDDLGDSYYYRGLVTNNYVQFGTYTSDYARVRGYYSSASSTADYKEYATLEECNAATSYNKNCAEYKYASVGDPMYWRIVRINGDGTIRLVYDGTTKVENGTEHASNVGKSAFNSNYDNAKYIGYTYDTSDEDKTQIDSTIKSVVDAWYDKSLKVTYGQYIADSIFCNDRSIGKIEYVDSNWDPTNNPNEAMYTFINYGAAQRITYERNPSLKCVNKSDRYTVGNTTDGNGLLSNPVGLITADEVIFSGRTTAMMQDVFSSYLESNNSYWTLSPGLSNNGSVNVYFLTSIFMYNDDGVSGNYAVRPVINLKADVEFTGDGTIDNPYKIVTE